MISDAIRNGDKHGPTMEMANFWITEKQYIHKLFKVIVPRLQNCPLSYTRMYKAPKSYPDYKTTPRAVLELRGNPFPSLKPDLGVNRNFIHNVLLEEAKKAYRRKKYAELMGETAAADEETAKKPSAEAENIETHSAEAKNIEKLTEQIGEIEIDESAKSKEPEKKE